MLQVLVDMIPIIKQLKKLTSPHPTQQNNKTTNNHNPIPSSKTNLRQNTNKHIKPTIQSPPYQDTFHWKHSILRSPTDHRTTRITTTRLLTLVLITNTINHD